MLSVLLVPSVLLVHLSPEFGGSSLPANHPSGFSGSDIQGGESHAVPMLPGDESHAYTDQDTSVYDRWSFEQLPMGQRIMNTIEKASTGVTPAQQNEQDFVMESINGHRGNRQRRSRIW